MLSPTPRADRRGPPFFTKTGQFGCWIRLDRALCTALGLDPGLGVLHVDSGNRNSLALDVVEPVRAQVDSYLVNWVTCQPLKRQWLFEQRDGNCRLMAEFAVRLSETATMWRRAGWRHCTAR